MSDRAERERVRNHVNRGMSSLISQNSDDRINESLSYGDDEIFFENHSECMQNISDEIPTSAELFDERKAVRVDSCGDFDLKDLFCKSGRRYEMGMGLNSIRADIFDMKPVSCYKRDSKKILLHQMSLFTRIFSLRTLS